jgi:hypothetical protein
MTPREAAIDLIRAYVERGDDPQWIRKGGMGSYSDRYHAQIGGYLFSGDIGTHYGTDKILVAQVNGTVVNQVSDFSVVLFRPNFMLVFKECCMKTHNHQWF